MQYVDTIIIVTTVIAAVYLQYRRDKETRLAENKVGSKLRRDKEANEEIYPIMWSILTEVKGARRVGITQFHNGGKFFSGSSINRMTMTHEVTRSKIAHVSKSLKDVIITRPFSITIDALLDHKIEVYNDVDAVEEIDLRNYLKYLKATSMAAFLLIDGRERPLGLMHVSSDLVDVFTEDQVEGLKLSANNIAHILENMT